MLGEAMKLQTEATLHLSNTVKKLAKNEERQITILENIVKIFIEKDSGTM